MECEVPTINSNDPEVKEMLENVKTIALMGLSPNEEKDSNKVAKYLLAAGYTVYPVYPKEDEILGQKVYRSLAEIPGKVDLVDVFRKPNAVDPIVDAAIARGDVDIIWTQLGVVNNEAAEKAEKAGMKVVQNKCTKIEHKKLLG
jgi:predicted CoA-binding protein